MRIGGQNSKFVGFLLKSLEKEWISFDGFTSLFDGKFLKSRKTGYYDDNALNRKLGRAGQKIPGAKQEEPGIENRQPKEKISTYAKKASTKALQEAVKNSKEDAGVKDVAEKELESRGVKPNPFSHITSLEQLEFYLRAPNEEVKKFAEERIAEIKNLKSNPKIKESPDYEKLSKKFSTLKDIIDEYKFSGETPVKIKGLDWEEQALLGSYTGKDYLVLNQEFRSGNPSEESILYRDKLDQTLGKIKDSYTGEVYRSLSFESSEELFDFVKELGGDNGEIKFAHPISTSEDEFVAESFKRNSQKDGKRYNIIFEINSKNGKEISSLSSLVGEREILFPSSSKFKMSGQPNVKKEKRGDYIIRIKLDEISGR